MRPFRASFDQKADEHFFQRFAACVEHSRKSHKEIGLAIGLSAGQVGRICRGGVQMVSDPAVLVRAAKLFGVSDVWLYAGPHAPAKFKPAWFA